MAETLHFTTVAIGGRAVLIGGVSGAGKSDLALRLIDRGAVLVSDDRTMLDLRDGILVASAPETIAGQIEVRGLGILDMPHLAEAPVALVVTLDLSPERMPSPARARHIAGLDIPEAVIDARSASAAIKVELALRRVAGGT